MANTTDYPRKSDFGHEQDASQHNIEYRKNFMFSPEHRDCKFTVLNVA